jgi:hypothetical protein
MLISMTHNTLIGNEGKVSLTPFNTWLSGERTQNQGPPVLNIE